MQVFIVESGGELWLSWEGSNYSCVNDRRGQENERVFLSAPFAFRFIETRAARGSYAS
jgi:hypothetical protein